MRAGGPAARSESPSAFYHFTARGNRRDVLVVQDIKDVTVQDEVLVMQDDLGISYASSDGGQSRSPPPQRRWLQEAPRTPR